MAETEAKEEVTEKMILKGERERANKVRAAPIRLGERIKALRRHQKWTLEETGRNTGLAASTLSKIENDQMSPTFDVVQKLATGFGVDITELFANRSGQEAAGRRSVTPSGGGRAMQTSHYANQLLASELIHKKILPFLTRIKARSLDDFEELPSHGGEEFLYVLEGEVCFHTELYESVFLKEGDSIYIDSGMQHACYSVSEGDALVLWIVTG